MAEPNTSHTDQEQAPDGWWFHPDGHLWWNGAPYVRRDGLVSTLCPELSLTDLRWSLSHGHLDVLERQLAGPIAAFIEAQGKPHLLEQLETVRDRALAARRGVR